MQKLFGLGMHGQRFDLMAYDYCNSMRAGMEQLAVNRSDSDIGQILEVVQGLCDHVVFYIMFFVSIISELVDL